VSGETDGRDHQALSRSSACLGAFGHYAVILLVRDSSRNIFLAPIEPKGFPATHPTWSDIQVSEDMLQPSPYKGKKAAGKIFQRLCKTAQFCSTTPPLVKERCHNCASRIETVLFCGGWVQSHE
jgi:hypothetical protein